MSVMVSCLKARGKEISAEKARLTMHKGECGYCRECGYKCSPEAIEREVKSLTEGLSC